MADSEKWQLSWLRGAEGELGDMLVTKISQWHKLSQILRQFCHISSDLSHSSDLSYSSDAPFLREQYDKRIYMRG